MLKTYYAYLAIAGGYLLHLVGKSTFLLFLACALTALGAFVLRHVCRRYAYAAVAELAYVALTALWILAQFTSFHESKLAAPVGTLRLMLWFAVDMLLLLAMLAQRKTAGADRLLEYALMAVRGAVFALRMVLLVMQHAMLEIAPLPVQVIILCETIFPIGMILAVFRAQRCALQSEASQ